MLVCRADIFWNIRLLCSNPASFLSGCSGCGGGLIGRLRDCAIALRGLDWGGRSANDRNPGVLHGEPCPRIRQLQEQGGLAVGPSGLMTDLNQRQRHSETDSEHREGPQERSPTLDKQKPG